VLHSPTACPRGTVLSRVRSTPISEQAIIGAAIGAAVAGMRPVAEIMLMNFLAVCMDQLFNHARQTALHVGRADDVPLTVRTVTGAGAGFGAQHSDMLEAWLAHAPGLKVVGAVVPGRRLRPAQRLHLRRRPCVFVEHTLLYYGGAAGPAPERGARIPIGRANTVREGSDVTLIAYGKPVIDAVGVADALAGRGSASR